MGIGDWGLGQSPIPNPQSPILIIIYYLIFIIYCLCLLFINSIPKLIYIKFIKYFIAIQYVNRSKGIKNKR